MQTVFWGSIVEFSQWTFENEHERSQIRKVRLVGKAGYEGIL